MGVAAGVLVAIVWGVLLSPRRPVDASLAVRVLVELALFVVVAAGLAAVGHPVWSMALLAAELLVVGGLFLRGVPPGSDLSATGR